MNPKLTKANPKVEMFTKGQLVQFYDDGLRAGHILTCDERRARVRPIGPKGVILRPLWLPIEDLIKVEPKEGSKLVALGQPIER